MAENEDGGRFADCSLLYADFIWLDLAHRHAAAADLSLMASAVRSWI